MLGGLKASEIEARKYGHGDAEQHVDPPEARPPAGTATDERDARKRCRQEYDARNRDHRPL